MRDCCYLLYVQMFHYLSGCCLNLYCVVITILLVVFVFIGGFKMLRDVCDSFRWVRNFNVNFVGVYSA